MGRQRSERSERSEPSESSEKHSGGCLCGAVRYELVGELGPLVNCHCRFCRRVHGAAFATSTPVRTSALRFLGGEQAIARYEQRSFCRECGTRLWSRLDARPELTMLSVSSLDEQPDVEPSLHLNLESMAPWYVIRDDAPRFDAFPPGVFEPDDGEDAS